jgi:hypothetical protein
MVFGTGCNNHRYLQFHLGESGELSPGLITFVRYSPLFTKIRKNALVRLVMFWLGLIIQGSLNNDINMFTQILHIHMYVTHILELLE